MKTINLSQALTLKNKIAKRVERAKSDVTSYNQVLEGETREIDPRARFAEYVKETDRLIRLKAAVAVANGPIWHLILEVAELKGRAQFVRGLGSKSKRTKARSYDFVGTEGGVLVAEYAKTETDVAADELETRIEAIQEQLAAFNARTFIDVDED